MINLYRTIYHNDNGEPARESATLAICSDLLRAGGHMTYSALNRQHHGEHFSGIHCLYGVHLLEDQTVRLLWLLEDSKELQGKLTCIGRINLRKKLNSLQT